MVRSVAHAAVLACALLISGVALVAQTPPADPDAAPTLAEPVELRRQNVVLRANLLQAQIELMRLTIEREQAAVADALAAVRAEVEEAAPGWTLAPDGTLARKDDTPKAEPQADVPPDGQ